MENRYRLVSDFECDGTFKIFDMKPNAKKVVGRIIRKYSDYRSAIRFFKVCNKNEVRRENPVSKTKHQLPFVRVHPGTSTSRYNPQTCHAQGKR